MASRDPRRPNVLFVMSDDQGAWALGCSGNADIRTPTLDASDAFRAGLEDQVRFLAESKQASGRIALESAIVPDLL